MVVRPVRRPTFLADERHEAHVEQFLGLELFLGDPGDAQQFLGTPIRDPTGITSRPPILSWCFSDSGTLGPPAATTMASYGACSGQPSVPSPCSTCTLSKPSAASVAAALTASWLVTLDRVDVLRDLREHCRRVARAGADLEHRLAALQQQCFGHQRDDVWLRDRLAFLDRQGRVVVGELAQVRRQECLARHAAHCVEDERGADTAVHDLPVHH